MILKWIMFNNMYLVFCIMFPSSPGNKPSKQNLHQNFMLTHIQTFKPKDRKLSLCDFYCGQK
jgi:hypothetical protein